jgi:hypothetical protein
MERNGALGGRGLDIATLFRDNIELRACAGEEPEIAGYPTGGEKDTWHMVGSSEGASPAASLAPRAR